MAKLAIDTGQISAKMASVSTMLLKRAIEDQIEDYLKGKSNKILFIWGPRRSGKTTLLEKFAGQLNTRIFDFDLQTDQELFVPRIEALQKLAAEQKIIFIDEIQNYPGATVVLKLLQGKFLVKIIATGSSELRQKAGEDFDSLAGRFDEIYCLPLSATEIAANATVAAYEKNHLAKQLQKKAQIFGAYPEVYVQDKITDRDKINLLEKIVSTYVLKDVINIYNLKDDRLARDILTKIALQLGSEVSVREIAASLGANKETVANYIEIFLKNYILIPLPSFKTNLRKAVSENRKFYFYDLGIRNALVKDFRELELRPDKGGVFENFIVSEVEKQRRNTGAKLSMYFYREYGGQEVDLVLEDYQKNYTAMEVKSASAARPKDIFPLPHTFKTVNPDNYLDIITQTIKR
ncbi:MAG: ATP-binding protein [Patescibacteria group bacterium]|nr:ATP-binding protein [Patescibacteria group bacterium]